MYIKHIIILTVLFFLLNRESIAQDRVFINDSTALDSARVQEFQKKNFLDPSRAAFLSAVLPGLGQAYNRKYWKIPIIYAGLVTGIFFANYYNNALQDVRSQLFDPGSSKILPETLSHYARLYRHSRDQSIVYTFIWYGLNIVDAHVDAYLKEFDVNDDLSLKWEPYFENGYGGPMVAGVTLKLQFK